MMGHYLVLLLILYKLSVSSTSGQCLTSNDIFTNETSLGATIRNLIEGSTQFGLQLLRNFHLNKNDQTQDGIFFSPFSIWSALIVTYMGAKGATELEMKNILGFGNADKIGIWDAFRNIRNFDGLDSTTWPVQTHSKESFHSANRIYFQQGTAFKDCMAELLEREVKFLDFATQPEESRRAINTWVEKETQDKIKDLIPPGYITNWTKMVIANAVFFKEQWEQQFRREETLRRKFTLTNRTEIDVAMMHTRGRFLYGKSDELHCYALELPYKGNALSMIILLPRNRYKGVDILTGMLTRELLNDLLNDMYPRDVKVTLPKFKLEDSFDLTSGLYKMGFKTLFDSNRVDLSGFTGNNEFQVNAAQHKAYIEVNEEGTEAAAATTIIESRSARPVGPASFTADYPFIYFIKDNMSGVILFLGTLQKPPEFENTN